MSDRITIEDTKHVAQLSNLDLSEKELQKLTAMFSDTLDYIAVLEELDTSYVKETFQVTGLKNVFQDRGVSDQELTQEQALKNASEVVQGKFVTEAVFDR